MKILGIKTNDGYYLTQDGRTYPIDLKNCIVNGEPLSTTFNQSWMKSKVAPTLVQYSKSMPPINQRYELIDKNLLTVFKDIWTKEETGYCWDDDLDESAFRNEEFSKISALYQFKQDTQPNIFESVEFEYETILEINEIKEPTSFSYNIYGDYNKVISPITNKSVKRDIITSIITPSILAHTGPCKLSREESYKIIRAYVKDNINPKVAEITSDYNFCFTVSKKVSLAKPYKYQVDINSMTRKKPKYVDKLQSERKIKVFEMAPAAYQQYPIIEPFEGNSDDDLKNNIDLYLTHLIGVINEPLRECDCCNGSGVLLNKTL